MRKHFEESLQELHNDLLRMGSVVEKQVFQSIKSLINKDINLSEEVIKNDDIVDELQKEIEDKCIKLIATQQPLATDLRTIFTTIKIVTDLERIADHATDIARITIRVNQEKYVKKLIDIPKMAGIVNEMIKDSLDAYVDGDVEKANIICKRDDEIDAIYKEVFNELLGLMSDDSKIVNQASQFLFVCKYLERIADHTTNICESTIYLVTGEMVDLND